MSEMTLRMPSNYVGIGANEMEYVEGGYYRVTKWWGVGIHLDGSETAQFLSDASWAAVAICGAIGIANVFAGGVAAMAIGTEGFIMSRCNRNNSGVTLMWNWTQMAGIMTNPLPTVIDNY